MPNSAQTITNRDLAIIRMVHEYEGCAIDHIQRRLFPTSGARTSCYRRISYLIQQGFLTSTRLPSLTGIGSGKAFLSIGPKARPILSQMLGIPLTELSYNRMASPVFLAHHFALLDIRLAFEQACENSSVFTLADWIGDRALHQEPIKVKDPKTGKVLTIIPDSAFTLELPDGSEQNFFLEMDMGTVAPKRMQAKLRAYLVRKGDPTPVLFVVPNEPRQLAIVHWALEESQDLRADRTIFWLTTKEALTEQTVLSAPIWQVVDGPDALALESLVDEPTQPLRDNGFSKIQTLNGHGGLFQ